MGHSVPIWEPLGKRRKVREKVLEANGDAFTDLLDCRGQVQAQLDDFVLCHGEIRDPCEWSPGEGQELSLMRSRDTPHTTPRVPSQHCMHGYTAGCLRFSFIALLLLNTRNLTSYSIQKGPCKLPRGKNSTNSTIQLYHLGTATIAIMVSYSERSWQ